MKVQQMYTYLFIMGLFAFTACNQSQPEESKSTSIPINSEDSTVVAQLFNQALTQGEAYDLLKHLCLNIGPRLSGSQGAADAVAWTKKVMEDYQFDEVYLQEVMVPHWERGSKESAKIIDSDTDLNILAIGGSVPTPSDGLTAEVVLVNSLEEIDALGESMLKGKIVFYNYPFKQGFIRSFRGYSDAVRHRVLGADRASKYGAKAIVIRSVTTAFDDAPHTGTLIYEDSTVAQIPAAALGYQSADKLAEALAKNPNTKLQLKINSKWFPDALSHNVIGQLTGSAKPTEIIVIGGHLDAWDTGHGAHDDGAGCIHSIEALRLLQKVGYKPKRTLRAVMFMNEENGTRGGRKYAAVAKAKGENHILAIESDADGFTPRGFGVTGSDALVDKLRSWLPYFDKNTISYIQKGGGGADIRFLNSETGTPLVGFIPDSQRYFDLHHSPNDTFDKINRRELELGAACMATLVYFVDKYGLPVSEK
ncbi:MAG: M20/M25/M40 family metallo-hydrolase [Flammeovirgaceae bacterium]